MEGSTHDPFVVQALEVLDGLRWLSKDDHALLTQALIEWRLDLLVNLSFMSKQGIGVTLDRRRVDLYPDRDLYRISACHPGNPTGSAFYIDSERRLCPASSFFFGHSGLLILHLERLLTLAATLDLARAPLLPVQPLEVQHWFANYGHVLDEWFTLARNHIRLSELATHLPVYDFNPAWGPTLHAKFETASAAIFRGAALNVSTLGATVHRCRNVALLHHSTADVDFLRFDRSIAERVSEVASHIERVPTASPSFGSRVFLTRSIPPNPADAVVNLDGLASIAAQAGFHVLNPEQLRFSELVVGMRDARSVVATWGSALTICAYATRGAAVTALRAGRYLDEDQQLIWGNLIDEHALDFTYLDTRDGVIDPDQFRRALARL